MLSRGFFEALKIDDLNRKWGARALFLVLLCLNFSIYFFNIGDSNFEAFFQFMDAVYLDPSLASTIKYEDIPLSDGNLIYIAFVYGVILALIIGGYFYCGLFIRDFRLNSKEFKFLSLPFVVKVRATTPEAKAENLSEEDIFEKLIGKLPEYKAISIGNLIFRVFVLSLVTIILFFPFFMIFYYLPLLALMVFPCILLSISSYLSGDCLFLDALTAGFKRIKGNYFDYMSGLSTLVLIFIIVQYLLASLDLRNLSPVYAVVSFINAYFVFALGRYVGMKHCIINDSLASIIRKKQRM